MFDTISFNQRLFPVRYISVQSYEEYDACIASSELATAMRVGELYGIDTEVTAIDNRIFFYVEPCVFNTYSDKELAEYVLQSI